VKVVVAEKPSVASTIAQVLGARTRQDGYFEGNGYQVSWAVGHLMEIAPPEVLNADWKTWRLDNLPLVPVQWQYELRDGVSDQFKVLKKLMCSRKTTEVICATDAGREGEHIFRLILQRTGATAPVKRLWISALTEEAIQKGFQNLRPSREFDGLAAAAEGRDKADWMVGLTLTRLYTVLERSRAAKPSGSPTGRAKAGGPAESWSVGRVQTPTLALVVARDLARQKFARTPYRQVRASFGSEAAFARGLYHREVPNVESGELELSPDLPSPPPGAFVSPFDDAKAVEARVGAAGAGQIRAIQRKRQKEHPPLLYDLGALQQDANRLWGWQAAHTLTVAQRLYQEHKVLSYPRTASRHLDEDTAATVSAIFKAVSGPWRAQLPAGAGGADLGKRSVDNTKVGDHHALIPTGRVAGPGLSADERCLYDLVVRRFLQMWAQPCVTDHIRSEVVVRSGHMEDLFVLHAKEVVEAGWTTLELRAAPEKNDEDELGGFPLDWREGSTVQVREVEVLDKTKSPPPAFTEATLLKAMETAGKRIEDPALEALMRDRGLGTPATRAAIIETLVSRGYLTRDGRAVLATEKGIGLIARVHPEVRTPEITGRWEQRLERIARGEERLEAFLADVADYLETVVELERNRAA
jgi:DNA topoisomerase-3